MDLAMDGNLCATTTNSDDAGPGAKIPLLRPHPPRLSELGGALVEIERSGIFSNYGPVNAQFEGQIIAAMFEGVGACVTVANATLGLMLAIKQAVGWQPQGRYALMPSFTFAAAAQAALWCGLTPLFCDIDRETWLPDADAEEALLRRYGTDIAVILPNATFGNCLDVARYEAMSAVYGIPLVIDGAAALGSVAMNGTAFGRASKHPVVFSMHATKAFAIGEGGLIYCDDTAKMSALRSMAGFGFNATRLAVMPGLNAKMSEVSALLALTKLQEIEVLSAHRYRLYQLYRRLLPEFTFQRMTGQRSAMQFVSILLADEHAAGMAEIISGLARHGIGTGRYFVPHLAEQPFFKESCVAGPLAVTDEISRRVICLPMSDLLTEPEIRYICKILRQLCHRGETQPIPGRLGMASIQAVR
jgi:dTDP-4-amino-4,6-dideoxygalactose transaminase